MPIYEYNCQKCSAHVEILQKITDKPLTKCPKCGGKLEKQWSQTSFQLKGSGWYVTDYARKGAAETKDKNEPAAATKTTTPAAEPATTAPAPETKGETRKTKKEKPAAPSPSNKE